jgi:predicted permease
MIRPVLSWLRTLLQRRRFERDLAEEMAFHLEERSRQLTEQGLDSAAARRQARIDLGMTQLHSDAIRRARGLEPGDALLRALRQGWRSLWRTPGFTASAMLVLGLPLAAIVMMYAMFATYALHTPPIDRAERWIYLEGIERDQRVADMFDPDLARALLQEPPAQVEGLFTHFPLWERITTAAEFRGAGAAVSDNFFGLSGLPMVAGRAWFGRDDPRDSDTLVLTEIGWRKLFDHDVDVVGRRVDIGDRSYTVIGVVGRGFSGIMEVGTLYFVRDQDRPRAAPAPDPDAMQMEVGGFLRAGADLRELNLALAARTAALTRAQPPEERLAAIQAAVRRGILRQADRTEAMLAGAPIGVIVLLILAAAAANLANLVLARFASRRDDLAVRASIGAGRTSLFFHLLTECLLLGLLAGALALVLVVLLMQPVHGIVFGLLSDAGLDILPLQFGPQAALLALGLSVFAALCFGALPAWWEACNAAITRSGASEAGVKRIEPRRLRVALMSLQLATSVFLVVVAGLVASNARSVNEARLGFDPTPLVALHAGADGGAMARAIARLDTVVGIAATSDVPFASAMPRVDAVLGERTERVHIRYVDAAWWALLGLPQRAGRFFHSGEDSAAMSAIVSQRAADLLWPERSPLGEALRLRAGERDTLVLDRRVEVVGVVDDLATGWLIGDASRAVIYLPASAGSAEAPVLLLSLRDPAPARLLELQRECRRLDPGAGCQPTRLTEALRIQRVPFAVASTLSTSLAWLALGISCVGLYGLVSYAVVQQRKALGVRLALGASDWNVIAHVMRSAIVPIAFGSLAGLAVAWGTSRLLAHFTDYLRSFSLDAFLLYPAVLILFALLAAWLPARRSTRIPVSACLRSH